MGQMDGKVAIVTGGACGIGAACARTSGARGRQGSRDRFGRRHRGGPCGRYPSGGRGCYLSASGRHRRRALAGGRRCGREAAQPRRHHGGQRRYRHQGADCRYDARRLAAAAGGESRGGVSFGQVCRAGNAARGRRLDSRHVVAGGLARRGGARRILCHQGRRAPAWPRPRPSSMRRTTFASTPYIPGLSTPTSGARW